MNLIKIFAILVTFNLYGSVYADSSSVYADVVVKISDAKLIQKAAGIRTLYITIHDEASKMPMPYGAIKVDLKKDVKDIIYQGKLDQKNVIIMGHGTSPKTMRIKAKLDKDGSAGSDAPGDLVGYATGVKMGEKVSITIEKAI